MEIIKFHAIEAGPGYNEAEVRFHIVDPIIRYLGYPDSENVYLNLEEKLEYPYVHIGRRSKRDVPLGFPDYRAGLKGVRGSFIVEAKAGGVLITNLEVEQAHSYAAHAQVGANYFVLCNGFEIRVYATLSSPAASALVTIPISHINDRIHEIENILSPASLEKNCKIEHDKGLKLCNGLGSLVLVRSGEYKISDYSYRIYVDGIECTDEVKENAPQLNLMDQQLEMFKNVFELRIAEGKISRDEDGRILSFARFSGVTRQNQEAMQMLGIDQMAFVTSDKFLSTQANNPTMFESNSDFAVSKGAMMPQLLGGVSEMEEDVSGEMFVRAAMSVEGSEVRGQYLGLADYFVSLPEGGVLKMELDFMGTFILRLDC